MDAHTSEDSGSGSEGAGTISNRERRKQQMQRKQQCRRRVNASSAAVPVDAATTLAGPTDVGGFCSSPGDGWAHDQQPPMTCACRVEYCPTCGMPFEYCEFSGAACAKQEEQQDAPNEGMVQQPAHEKQLSDEFQEKAAISNAKRGAGKTVGAKPKVVTVQKQAKRRGKYVTNIWGLENFGVKQEVAAKLASKHFACGSSFQKGQPGQAPSVEIQGDVEETVAAFLLKNFEIPEDKVVFLPEK
ncbi:translation machinery-associated protein 22 [Cyclospora cayetanensis]|uniref:Translation machinery-associated protein 22 n=1 Tax=Cyclospora cayetanensis TaxID=88456 RepID=A0A6P6S1T5_9EIME|nr:translation machinery-associated protein 22 [Cyclospora cayetanensis]